MAPGASPNFMKQAPAPVSVNLQRPARSTGGGGGGGGCGGGAAATSGSGGALLAQPTSAVKTSNTVAAFAARALHRRICVKPIIRGSNQNNLHFIVGMTNSAPSFAPDGQRAVTVLVLV